MAVYAVAWMLALRLEEVRGAIRIRVRVKPRAAKSRVLGARDGALEVALAAPPVDGAANSELIRLLAATLDSGKSAIRIVSGEASRSKLVAVAGFTADELLAKLNQRGLPSAD